MAFSDNWNDVYPRGEFQEVGPGGSYCNPTSGFWGKARASNPRVADREGMSTGSSLCAPFRSQNFRNGDGSSAAEIQRRLNKFMANMRQAGLSGVPAPLTVDGVLGSASDAAIKWFQGRRSLTADGLVGNSTWQKLRYA